MKNYNQNPKNNLKKIMINKLTPGMKLARDVDYSYGGKLLLAGTILDKHKINRLKKNNYKYIFIFDEGKERIEENIEKIEKVEADYQEKRKHIKSVFKRVKKDKEISYKEIQNLSEEVTNIGNDKDIINLLTKVRKVDQYTYSHLLNVGMLAYMFGNWLGLKDEKRLELTQAGLLHDLGKAYISDDILNKPGELTKSECEEMKKHTIYGYKMVRKVDSISETACRGILTHHERYNGSGYPLKIKGKKIPFYGRVLGIVDTFDAMTADRVYKKGKSPFKAIKLFQEETVGSFDIRLAKIFLEKIPNYFKDEKVILNNGKKAKIVFINPRHPNKPIIEIDDSYIDLYKNDDLDIQKLVN